MHPGSARRGRTVAGALHRLGLLLLAGLIASAWCGAARAEIVMTDAAGREVRLQAPAQRIATNESLLLLSLALIDADPVRRLAGWAAPRRLDQGMYAAFRREFPAVDDIPVVGAVVPAGVSVETILSVEPDLFVVSIWQHDWEDIADRLSAAGIPVIFLDGPANAGRGPDEATAFSMELLGKALGREEQAGEFADFVRARYRRVEQRLEGTTRRPSVLIDAHAGSVCCNTPGADNRITQYLELAGGHNIGAGLVPGYDGQLSPEYVLTTDPDVYVGTGGPHLAAQGGLVVGGAIDAGAARASLSAVVGRNHLSALSAVRGGRAFAVSHQLSISALSVLVFECLAKWTHPDLFADLDPADTLAEINERFMAVPIEGTFWVGLDEAGTAP
ncbi:ABC transporter substrate-binding protein [Aquamicrobium sp. LC103]|uniref:ABC transporter substrate-binding protein n=1 Tax=Aquamicrobium sp. LC103 TaxID=1120658 RepID=UPI001FF02434|nr:ABC transporter substrate-binding protein [Aquamicrobium sp. LC103]